MADGKTTINHWEGANITNYGTLTGDVVTPQYTFFNNKATQEEILQRLRGAVDEMKSQGILTEDIHQKGGSAPCEQSNVFNVDISSLDNILKLLMPVIKPGQITINQNFGSSPQIINPENVESGGYYSFHEGSQKVNKINNQSNKHDHGRK